MNLFGLAYNHNGLFLFLLIPKSLKTNTNHITYTSCARLSLTKEKITLYRCVQTGYDCLLPYDKSLQAKTHNCVTTFDILKQSNDYFEFITKTECERLCKLYI